MAERTLQILPGGQSAAPFTYLVPASTSFTLLGVRATFDGSGAGGDFLPCVQLVSDASVVMAFGLGASVAAGDSADVTFAPFLRGQTSAASTASEPLWDVLWSNGFGNNQFQDPTGSLDWVAWFNAAGVSYNGTTSLIDVDPTPDKRYIYFPKSAVRLWYLAEFTFFMPPDPQIPPIVTPKTWDVTLYLYQGDIGSWGSQTTIQPTSGAEWARTSFRWIAREADGYSGEEGASIDVIVGPLLAPVDKYAFAATLFQTFPTGVPLDDFQSLPGARCKLTELYLPTFPPV